MCSIAERYPLQASFEIKSYIIKATGKRTGSYVELTCGKIRITQASVATRHSLPRDAAFRSTLAKDAQRSLAFDDQEEVNDGGEYLYGVLLHSVDVRAQNRKRPGFSCIRFPNRSFTGYVSDGIDLFVAFPDIVTTFIDVAKDLKEAAEVKAKTAAKKQSA
jgi:hypothetical protein